MSSLLGGFDVAVIVLYFVSVIGVGLWSSCLNRGGTTDYFLAGRSMYWVQVGASLFASNIGSGHFVGLAGTGAANGLAISFFEFNGTFCLPLLGWLFLPVYISSGVFTMPEYLRKRFGGQRIRVYLAVLALLLYIFTKISADLYAGALFLEQSVPSLDLYSSITILLVISASFTILGGLTAVMWTDFIQTVIMIIGAIWLMIVSFVKIDGMPNLRLHYFTSVSNTSQWRMLQSAALDAKNVTGDPGSWPTKYAFNMARPITDSDLPWMGVFGGSLILASWYWCSDQVIVQRALSARNLTNAKGGCILASYLKMLPLWIMVFPGMIARALYPDEVGCTDPDVCEAVCGKRKGCSDIAFPKLVLTLMPSGAKGLMLAVMLSSLVSSLTGVFNSASTIFTIDVWKRLRKRTTDVEVMIVGRIFVIVLVTISVAWLPIVRGGGQLFAYIQAVTSYLAPPIAAVFLLAVLWHRTNEPGAFWSLMVGLLVGMVRFIWEYSYGADGVKPPVIADMNYLHFAILLFSITVAVCCIVSLRTTKPDPDQLHRLLFWTRFSLHERKNLEDDADKNVAPDSSATETAKTEAPKDVESGETTGEASGAKKIALKLLMGAAKWVCGIENMGKSDAAAPPPTTPAEDVAQLVRDITETRKWRYIVNSNVIFLMVISVFFCALFG